MTGQLLEYIFVIPSLIGSYFVANKKVIGFWYWLVADVAGVLFALWYAHYAFAVLSFAYGVMCVYSIKMWSRK
jgi:hypothetical protein